MRLRWGSTGRKQETTIASAIATFWCITVEPAGAPMMRPIWSPTVSGISHQPSAHARRPRSFHVRAYAATRSSAAAGIAPSEWLIRYVVCSRIGNRSRYDVRSVEAALGWSDIAGRRPEEPARALLLEDVGRPAGDARAREHGRRQRRRDLGDVEHKSRVVLDVRSQGPLRMPTLELGERSLFEPLGDLDLGRAELARRPLQDARARILGTIDAMAEAHDALTRVESVADPLLGIAQRFDLVEHRLDVRRRASVERARQRPDSRRERRAAIGPGRRRDARSERRCVEPVLGGANPVRVDRLDVTRIGLAAPSEQELLGSRPALRDHVVGDRIGLAVGDTRRARNDPHHLRREAAEIFPCLLIGDLVELPELPLAGEPRRLGLQVGRRVAGEMRRLVRLGIGHLRLEVVIDEQPPDVLVRVVPHELLDVDAPITKHAAFPVGLGNLRLDGDDAFEARLEVVVAAHRTSNSISRPTDRSRAAASTSAAAAASWTAMPTDLYRLICSGEVRPRRVPATSSPSSTTSVGARSRNSAAPAGGGASVDSRYSTATTAASRTIAGSTSPAPAGFAPTELTCTPGWSHSRRTIGSVACVVAAMTSAPRTAASNDDAAEAPSSPASASARFGSREATRTSRKSRTRRRASACVRACTPAPRIASTRASSRARSRVASAEPAAVRVAVM